MDITSILKDCDFTLRFQAKRIGLNRYVKVSFAEISNIIVNLISLPSTKTAVSYTIDQDGRLVVPISGEGLVCNSYGIEILGFYNNGNWRHQIAPIVEIVNNSTEDNYALGETDNLTLDFDIILGETYVSSRAFGGTIDAILTQIQRIIQSVTDAVSGASSAVNTHNTSNTAHEDIRQLISSVSSTLSILQEQVWTSDTNYTAEIQDLQNQINAIVADKATVSLTASPSVVFIGEQKPITLTAKSSPVATSTVIKKGNTEIQTGTTGTVTGSDTITPSGNVSYQAEFVIAGITRTANATVSAVHPIYVGAGATAEAANTKQSAKTSPAGTYNVPVVISGSYVWFLIPNNMTINSAKKNGFDFPLESPTTTTKDGVAYKVYRSSNTYDAGTETIVIS